MGGTADSVPDQGCVGQKGRGHVVINDACFEVIAIEACAVDQNIAARWHRCDGGRPGNGRRHIMVGVVVIVGVKVIVGVGVGVRVDVGVRVKVGVGVNVRV